MQIIKTLIFILFISLNLHAEVFDLECISIDPSHNYSETLKIIYEPNRKDVLKDGTSLINDYDKGINALQNLESLTVDNEFIKFSYTFSMDNPQLGKAFGVHERVISRSSGLMKINASGSGVGYDQLKPVYEFKYKCSKRKNEF